ncbi:DNA polymerase III subunit gamma/tau [Buchnera aphidicola (Kurisakia onigurumii)]|uniref:DNA polymerase III subunit gamma/tau n=1 Tax=Buchnera aphidicola TaxID=9 RepID=UPI0031B713BC
MKYEILARKWRPQSFSEIVGQKYIVRALKNSISSLRIHQSWIFYGSRGTGKTSLARILTKSLNCKFIKTGNPCKICSSCMEIQKGNFIDLIEIDAASRTRIEDIKEILENMQYSPSKGIYKVYLIDEVHMLSNHSFNALLKILEEPPKHVKFILATTIIKKVPDTIISRCLCFNLKKINKKEIYQHLKKVLRHEKIEYEKNGLKIISDKAEGSIRDALSIVEQTISMGNEKIFTADVLNIFGMLKKKNIISIIKNIFLKKTEKLFQCIKNIDSLNVDWEELLNEMIILVHHIAIIKNFNNSKKNFMHMNTENHKKIEEISNYCHIDKIQLYYKILIIGKKELKLAPNPKIGIEMIFFRLLNLN